MLVAPNKMPKRAVIYAQDIVNIMGVQLRTAYRLMEKIRAANSKPKHAYITVTDFSAYTGIPESKVYSYIPD